MRTKERKKTNSMANHAVNAVSWCLLQAKHLLMVNFAHFRMNYFTLHPSKRNRKRKRKKMKKKWKQESNVEEDKLKQIACSSGPMFLKTTTRGIM